MRGAKNTIKFRSRKQSVKGMIALMIAISTILATIALIIVVTGAGGNSGILTGVLGLLLMVVAAGGFALALKSLYERDILSVLPITALLLNGFVVIFYLCMYVIGF
mgnify:CR=1 FL=1